MRSARVSPMPIRMPVVKGTRARPAASKVASRTAGTLSGEPKCGPPRCDSRSDAVSSMMPCDTDTLRRRASHASSITPGLRCGSSPVSFSTSAADRSRYSSVDSAPSARKSIAGRRVAQLRLVAQREQRLLAAGRLAPAGDVEHGLGREVVRLGLARRVRERAVVAHVPAQLGQRDEHLLGEAHVRAVAGEAEPLRQRRERGEVVAFGQRHRFERGQAPPALGGCKRLSDAGRRHGSFPWGLDCSVSDAAACGARKA